jgi:ribosomal protein L11 methyltransferase
LQPADIMLANILAEPLEALAPTLTALVAPGGHIVLSGLLSRQTDQVAARYAPAFRLEPVTVQGDWARLDGRRRAAAI